MIRKIYEAYIEFIQSRSDASAHVELSEYTLKSKLPQVHLNRTLRGLIFQSLFNCCSHPECLCSKIPNSTAPRCGAERKRIVWQINSAVRQRDIACNSARINKYRAENAEFRRNERAATDVREKKRRVKKIQNAGAMNEQLMLSERQCVVWKILNSVASDEQLRLSEKKKRRVENPKFRRNEKAPFLSEGEQIVWKILNSDAMNEQPLL